MLAVAERFKWWMICCILITLLFVCGISHAKELPLLVGIPELSTCCDGKRVVIIGYGRSSDAVAGRMGSRYAKTLIGKEDSEITVYSTSPVFNMVGNKVIVQGVYHREGKFGGFLAKDFIVAEYIERIFD